MLLVSGENHKDISNILTKELQSCSEWLVDNKLSLHLGKTDAILCASKRKPKNVQDFKVKCNGVVEEVKRQTLKWFGHVERMEEGKMTKRVHVSEIEGGNVRGRPPVKWRDRVQEYVRERGERSLRNLEQARGECQDRERWKLFCRGHPLVGARRSRHRNELN